MQGALHLFESVLPCRSTKNHFSEVDKPLWRAHISAVMVQSAALQLRERLQ